MNIEKNISSPAFGARVGFVDWKNIRKLGEVVEGQVKSAIPNMKELADDKVVFSLITDATYAPEKTASSVILWASELIPIHPKKFNNFLLRFIHSLQEHLSPSDTAKIVIGEFNISPSQINDDFKNPNFNSVVLSAETLLKDLASKKMLQDRKQGFLSFLENLLENKTTNC